MDLRLYIAQRLSAIVMIPLVFGHIGVMIYAIQGGLSAEEILSRTQGSIFWFLFYGLFVFAVSVHGAIGLRTIVSEVMQIREILLDLIMWSFGLVSIFLGARAVSAVTWM